LARWLSLAGVVGLQLWEDVDIHGEEEEGEKEGEERWISSVII
jgi:hypothetical protein